ncbi:hypothetical protein HRG_014070 [Hirsutella rhossiliensis]
MPGCTGIGLAGALHGVGGDGGTGKSRIIEALQADRLVHGQSRMGWQEEDMLAIPCAIFIKMCLHDIPVRWSVSRELLQPR